MEDLEKELKLSVVNELEDHINELSDALNGKSEDQISEEDINLIFRVAHSIKGNTRASGFDELAEVSHFFESKLMDVKIDHTRYNDKYHDLCLSYLDLMSVALEELNKDIDSKIDINTFINSVEEMQESKINKDKPVSKGMIHPTRQKLSGNLLLIDDDESILEIISEYINDNFDATISTELNGQEAIATTDEERFDVIVCDYKMPSINGTEFIKMLRHSTNSNKHTPIVFLSGYKPKLNEPGEVWDNVFFIDKPFAESKLIYYIKCSLSLNKERNVA